MNKIALNKLTTAQFGEGCSYASNTGDYNVTIDKYVLNGNINNLFSRQGGQKQCGYITH